MLVALGVAAAAQEPDRSQTTVPAFSIFERMLQFAAVGDQDKIARSLELLTPVVAEHERVLGAASVAPVAAALRSTDRTTLERAVQALVARDIVVLLRRVDGAPRDRARTLARTAVLEWRLLEAVAVARDLRASQAVAGGLRDLGESVDAGDVAEARGQVAQLEKELLQLFRLP